MRQDSAAFLDRSSDFHGAKGVVLVGDRLLALLRDDHPGLPWAGWWDLPGGGREAREAPAETFAREAREERGRDIAARRGRGARGGGRPAETCAREAREELGLDLAAAEWLWARPFASGTDPARRSW